MTTMEKVDEALEIVREAVEAAQDYADAWEAIEAWLNLDVDHELVAKRSKKYGDRYTVFLDAPDKVDKIGCEEGFGGDTRLKALEQAARWCRQAMAEDEQ